MDLTTEYLGLKLKNPFMPGASPLVDDLDTVKRLEDAGASAIVMHSLFEEQLLQEQLATFQGTEKHRDAFAEAASFFPEPKGYRLGPDQYLEHLRKVRKAVGVPVIASLNGTTPSGWLEYAKLMEKEGADAIELNVYTVGADANVSGVELERKTLEMIRALKRLVKVPVAVKLTPFFTSLSHFAADLEEVGADGLVLFNRLFQADIDPDALELKRTLVLSDKSELPLRLRWLGILSPELECSLAASGGVHDVADAVRALMAGADVVQLVSALLTRGPRHLAVVRDGLAKWLEEHEYESLGQLRGSMSLEKCPAPDAYVRANYVHMLQSWRPS